MQFTNSPAAAAAPLVPPLLAELGLTADELAALRRQGFVRPERRGKRCVFKLRFRSGGNQVVRFLGPDPVRAALIADQVRVWQAGRRLQLAARRLRNSARERWQENQGKLAPLLEQAGYHFHGRTVRRRRRQSA